MESLSVYNDMAYQTSPSKMLQALFLNNYMVPYFLYDLDYNFPDESLNSSSNHIDKGLELLYENVINNEKLIDDYNNYEFYKNKNNIINIILNHLVDSNYDIESFLMNDINFKNTNIIKDKDIKLELIKLLVNDIKKIISIRDLTKYKNDNKEIIKIISNKSKNKLSLYNDLTNYNNDVTFDMLIKHNLYHHIIYPVIYSLATIRNKVESWNYYRKHDSTDQFYRLRKV